MLQKLYSVRDAKANVFNPPRACLTHGEAERGFKTAANDKSTAVGMYPEDYDLYFLGEFDTDTGKMLLLDTPQHIVKATQLIQQ